jgi:ubiquinone/menaquinone biosynthesis C-methylase UbiE
MSFDAIAPHYRGLETVTAGPLLQRCRTAFLHELPGARHILLLGEGRGRFLLELMRVHPETRITCLDSSTRMLQLSRSAVRKQGLSDDRVTFLQANVLAGAGDPGARGWQDCEYDAVASHFFLDCFQPHQLHEVIGRVAGCVTPGARWLISDFCVPESGWRRVRARFILAGLYTFFRIATRLPAQRLTPPDSCLQRAGFQLKLRRHFNFGLLHSDVWQKGVRGS